ncbi:vestitone reductase-like [Cornus florida]|uniref:vestitone reductase-like n=1 Tax=Cornus florida TaxID=4283 RepID=UPI00289E5266|nr:vestitone reductase-like [Cornus florida]
MARNDDKGIVCVTGGTGYLASWLIMKLLQHGYSVRTTTRSVPEKKKDVSFLTNLPGASEKLQIFNADLEQPGSFDAAIEGCIGVFHVAHPIDFEDKEPEQVKTRRAINGTLSILKACLDSKTVKRVVYTSSASTVVLNDKGGLEEMDESKWSDIDFIRELEPFGASYMISKTLTERAALKFAEEHGLDLVTVIPSFIGGPFICPHCPGSVYTSLAMIFGSVSKDQYKFLGNIPLVHVDDVASAHIFLFENPNAKGRYICSAKELTIYQMSEYLSVRYPEYQIPKADCLKEFEGYFKHSGLSSKKLLDAGFKYKYGLDEMYDEAIQCCKEKGFL